MARAFPFTTCCLNARSAASTKRYSQLATKALGEALAKIGKKSPTPKKQKAA